MTRVRLSLTVALLGMLAALPAFAQGQAIDGIIEGSVRAQPEEGLVSGATIRAFNTGHGRRLELIVEAFNLANRLNPTNVNRTWGPNPTANANFNTPTGAETARQFQLAARYSF